MLQFLFALVLTFIYPSLFFCPKTTWKKPPGFAPAQAPAKGTPRSARRPATKNQDKPKVVGKRDHGLPIKNEEDQTRS